MRNMSLHPFLQSPYPSHISHFITPYQPVSSIVPPEYVQRAARSKRSVSRYLIKEHLLLTLPRRQDPISPYSRENDITNTLLLFKKTVRASLRFTDNPYKINLHAELV